MNGQIAARLATAAEAEREFELTSRRRDALRGRAGELQAQIALLRQQYENEQHDVDRLEGHSLTRVIASLRGAREDRLERERAEAEAARYRVAEAQARLDSVSRELSAAQARLRELAGAPAEYEAALAEKEGYLRQTGDPLGAELLGLSQEQGRLSADRREVAEAVAAAQRAAKALQTVAAKLDSASGWSTYDTFFGGGMFASAIKHSAMDEAAAAAARADQCLLALRTELADVAGMGATAPALAIGQLTRFVDIWFDNIFTDLAVRDRIRQAKSNVANSRRAVDELHQRLMQRDADDRARLAAIETERRTILTGRAV